MRTAGSWAELVPYCLVSSYLVLSCPVLSSPSSCLLFCHVLPFLVSSGPVTQLVPRDPEHEMRARGIAALRQLHGTTLSYGVFVGLQRTPPCSGAEQQRCGVHRNIAAYNFLLYLAAVRRTSQRCGAPRSGAAHLAAVRRTSQRCGAPRS
eukprot:gene13312-biopygen6506